MRIVTEDAACDLRGDIVIFNLFVIVRFVCMGVIPSRKKVTFITVIKNLHLFVNAVTF